TRDRARAARRLSRARAPGLRGGRLPPGDVLLSRQAAGSDAAANASARVGGGATPVRVSTTDHPAAAGGLAGESQAGLSAVRRGAGRGAGPTPAGTGHPGAGGAPPARAPQ